MYGLAADVVPGRGEGAELVPRHEVVEADGARVHEERGTRPVRLESLQVPDRVLAGGSVVEREGDRRLVRDDLDLLRLDGLGVPHRICREVLDRRRSLL